MSGFNQIVDNYQSNDYVENKDDKVESADIKNIESTDTNIDQSDIEAVFLLKQTYKKANHKEKQQLNEEFNKFTPEINEALLDSAVITEHDRSNVRAAKNLRYALRKYPNLSPVARSKIETFAQKQAELQKGAEDQIEKVIDVQNGTNEEKTNEDVE